MTIQVSFSLSRRLVTGLSPRKLGFDSRLSYVRSVVDKVALGRIPLQVIVFPFQYISTDAPYLPSSACCTYQKEKKANPGYPPKSSSILGNRKRCVAKYIHLFRDSEVKSIVLLNLPSSSYRLNAFKPPPVAARPKAWVCDRSLAGIVGSNPA